MSKPRPGKTLTERQRAFCEEYITDLNGQAAAVRAGYSPKTARQIAVQILGHTEAQKYLQKLLDERSKRTQVTADRVITEAARIGFSDLRRLFGENGELLPVNAWPDDVAASVASVEIDELFEGYGENRVQVGHTKKIKLWDKPRALELLGKHLKIWVERMEHTGKDGGPIQTRDDGIDLSTLTDDELEQLERLRQAAEQRRADR
jgi:phage terminase small subunit